MFLSSSFWFPEGASTIAHDHDWLFNFILAISTVFFVLIIAVGSYFVLKYRRRPGLEAQPSPTHNGTLEILWSVIPSILIVFIFYYGFSTYLSARRVPPSSYEVQVVARTWSWEFSHENGAIGNELYVPVGRPVRLVMTSDDLVHSLSIPDFRLKQDVVPGRYTETWFEATETGSHQLYCTEYCGSGHSLMLATVHVVSEADFAAWLDDAANYVDRMPPAEAGERVFREAGCATCHSIDGSSNRGPSLWDSFGSEQLLNGGSRVTVDENYLRESILEPQAKVVAGFDPIMPTFKGSLNDKKVAALIAYLKTLSPRK